MIYTAQIFIALILDLLFGDPRWYPHPVRFIGMVCDCSEKLTRKLFTNLFVAGFFTVLSVLLITAGFVYFLLSLMYYISPLCGDICAIFLLYTSFAAMDLIKHSNAVFTQLQKRDDLHGARLAVGKIVGRDTQNLSRSEVNKACVETVAENMVDGITAPFFFAILFSFLSPYVGMSPIGCSAIGALLYKGVNTMDSMIGYKNEKYLKFGTFAAKLDDVVNFFPARMSGLLLIVAALILKLDYRGAARIYLRDRLCHSSPNAGHTEATVAGALGIRLGGPLIYFGKVVEKSYLGDNSRTIVDQDIKTSNKLVIIGSILFFIPLLLLVALI